MMTVYDKDDYYGSGINVVEKVVSFFLLSHASLILLVPNNLFLFKYGDPAKVLHQGSNHLFTLETIVISN